jgi:hypothetical protein
VATAVQQRQRLELNEISELAKELTEAVHESDHVVIQALSGPAGPPLITNLCNVGILATKIAMGLGYYGVELHRLAFAALVHDIGIFSIPQRILQKTGPVTTEERVLIEEHPRLGAETIQQAGDAYRWLAEVVAQAHERWMGQGYPNKLRGRQINELAQIIGLVDVFDALVSPRPYRRRLLPHEAVRELLTNERNAFPREVMKALVEQLSVYPLGTKVRMNTGEEGIVVGINPRYPCRPCLALARQTEAGGAASERTMDLSATPLVWVTDTIAPPDIDSLPLASAQVGAGAGSHPGRSSDQFAALLESLDAIADVIQAAVETRPPSEPRPSEKDRVESEGTRAAHRSLDKEVVGLFALEAREWIRQIQTALAALEHTADKRRQSELERIMLQGMSHLARSAGTIPLPAIEHMAVELLPLLDRAGRQHPSTAAQSLDSLQEGLARLAQAVRQLPCEAGLDPPPAIPEAALVSSDPTTPQPCREESEPDGSGSTGSILDALRRLHEARGRSMQPVRDILDEIIRTAERLDSGSHPVDAQCIGRILSDLDAQDEHFLQEIMNRVPALDHAIGELKKRQGDMPISGKSLGSVLHEIESLHGLADHVHAVAITTVLQCFRGLLLAGARGNSEGCLDRLLAFRPRLAGLVPLANQWVEIGRIERTAIIDILPV